MLPNCIPSCVLIFYFIFGPKKKINWLNIKVSWRYIVKEIVIIVLAVIINKYFTYLRTTDISPDFRDVLEIVLTIPVGIIWYREYKKFKKNEEQKGS